MAQNDADEALADLQEEYSRLEINDSQSEMTSAASSAESNNANARLRELTPEKICAEASKAADADYLQFRLLAIDYLKKYPKKEDRSLHSVFEALRDNQDRCPGAFRIFCKAQVVSATTVAPERRFLCVWWYRNQADEGDHTKRR